MAVKVYEFHSERRTLIVIVCIVYWSRNIMEHVSDEFKRIGKLFGAQAQSVVC